MAQPRRSTGRRPGPTQTREAILAAAEAAFVEEGYAGATIRGVARAAGVDQALVLHYFESKDGLFAAALRTNPPLHRLVEVVGHGDIHDLGERLVRCYLRLWEDPETSTRLLAIFRAASMSASASAMVAEFIGEVMAPLAEGIGSENAKVRAALAGSHLFGTSAARYVLRVEPLASLAGECLVAILGPVIQHYLTGDLDHAQISPPTARVGEG
jgi:AcrR family transcriptional regulator